MIMKRDGSWVVELIHPLKHNGKEVAEVTLRPPTYDIRIRWARSDGIPSVLQLLAELTKQPERLLRLLVYPDVDRVMLALFGVLPDDIAGPIRAGQSPKPLETPEDELELIEPPGIVSDQSDDRFPLAEPTAKKFPEGGPVFKAGPPQPKPTTEGSGFAVDPDQGMVSVNKVA